MGDTWIPIGWDASQLNIDYKNDYYENSFESYKQLVNQNITLSMKNSSPDDFWTCHGIYRQQDLEKDLIKYTIRMSNGFTGVKQEFYCVIPNEFICNAEEEDVKTYLLHSLKSVMNHQQIKSFTLVMSKENTSGWIFAENPNQYVYDPTPQFSVGGSLSPSRLSNQMPGMTAIVKHPINGNNWMLREVIINLNDGWKWSREQIADWLETLDVDLRFQTKENDNEQDR